MKKIVFVCTGNTCRSPMAMAVFNKLLEDKGILDWEADSAGLAAFGDEINPNSVKALAKIGIDFNDYRSKSLTTDMLFDSDLIVTMTADQSEFLKGFKGVEKKLRILNVPDPFLGDEKTYELCLDKITKGLDPILEECLNDY